jgi:hypothetical protein
MRSAACAIVSMQMTPEYLGTIGYDAACNETETEAQTFRALRTMQIGGTDHIRNMYKPSERQACAMIGRGKEALRQMIKSSAAIVTP